MAPTIIFSNRIETLHRHLLDSLFANTHPFAKRLVIVPSNLMKSWLMRAMAEDSRFNIAAGIDVCLVESAIQRLYNLSHQQQWQTPSTLEITLALEASLYHRWQNENPEDPVWAPILQFIGTDPSKVRNKIYSLAETLSSLFYHYGIYGGRIIDQGNAPSQEEWQIALWKELELLFKPWGYPYRKLSHPTKVASIDPKQIQVHIFGVSYLAPIYENYFHSLSKIIPTSFYVLSPCKMFWSDLSSQKESLRIEKALEKRGVSLQQREELLTYLADTNSLLANFGKVGREMAKLLEKRDSVVLENYALPLAAQQEPWHELDQEEIDWQQSSEEITLLEALQADLLLMRNPSKTPKKSLPVYDGTIQIHSAPSIAREVEALYHTILSLLEKHRNDKEPLTPGDIIVMVTNIEKYAPFIKSTFKGPESCLQMQLMDLKAPITNTFIQAFLHLMDLAQGRWEVASTLRLFEYRCFQGARQFSDEELHLLSRWITKANIRWGHDTTHKKEKLKIDHGKELQIESNLGTWNEGMNRLLDSIFINEIGNTIESEFLPVDSINSTEAEFLGEVLHTIKNLRSDFQSIQKTPLRAMSAWSEYFIHLCSYLQPSNDEEKEGRTALLNVFIELGKANPSLPSYTYSFNTVVKHLKKRLEAQELIQKDSLLHAIKFCSLVPMRAIPAKVVVLMGMEEEAFPKILESIPFDLCPGNPLADYCPTQDEFDRYFFLEALLSARRYLILSYNSKKAKSQEGTGPSPAINELLHYLDTAFSIEDKLPSQRICFEHPYYSFDKSYFASNPYFKSHAQSDYALAQVYYNKKEKKIHQFLSQERKKGSEQGAVIDLADLLAFAKNPLKKYVNATLGIYLEEKKNRWQKEEATIKLMPYQKAMITRQAFLYGAEKSVHRATKLGDIPHTPFTSMESQELLEELSLYDKLKTSNPFSIEFSDKYTIPLLKEDSWKLPALKISAQEVLLVGKWNMVLKSGLVIFKAKSFSSICEILPEILSFGTLVKQCKLDITPNVHLISKGKVDHLDLAALDCENLLSHFLNYYKYSTSHPSPLHPKWIDYFFGNSPEEILQKINTSIDDPYQPNYDDYAKWMKRNCTEEILFPIEEWIPFAEQIYAPLQALLVNKKPGKGGSRETD